MIRAARRPRGRFIALSLTTLALATSIPFAAPAAGAPAAAAPFGPGSATLTILGVTPNTPDPAKTAAPLTVTFRIRNNTDQPLDGVQVSGERGTPIGTQAALDSEIARPTPPDPDLVSPIKAAATTVDVPAGSTEDEVFTTTTGIPNIPSEDGICLCRSAIYPLYFTAAIVVGDKTYTLATAQSYLPSFDVPAPAKLQVAWVWPLLDSPHRLTSSTVFTDDQLAQEVAPGGRLDRALAVLETVTTATPTAVPMTVVTDPDLIDELEVMAEGNYTVTQASGPPVLGTGAVAAAAWLTRLRTVLSANPSVELDFTPYGDPDVEALHRAGLSWTNGVPAAAQQRIATALGGITPLTDLDWPVGQTVGPRTLSTLVHQGTHTVIVNEKTVPGIVSQTTDALAQLSTPSGKVDAGVVDSSIETWAAKVLVPNSAGLVNLPQFVAQVALHAVSSVDTSHFVLITPPRLLNVDPTVAARAILETSTGIWAAPTTLRDALSNSSPKAASKIVDQPGASLPPASATALYYVADSLPGLSSLFTDADRQAEVGSLPTAAQLAASSSLLTDPYAAATYAGKLRAIVAGFRNGVHLVKPVKGTYTYTLTSTNSSIPITIANDLTVPVQVSVSASAVGGLSGFAATTIASKSIAARTTVQVRLPTHFDRTGRIEVQVTLATPASLELGDPVQLSVRSTALGTIGVVITTVAGVVLVVALLVRVAGRLRRERRKKAAAPA